MNPINDFIDYFRKTLDSDSVGLKGENSVSNTFLDDFVKFTPLVVFELGEYIEKNQWELFYSRLNDLKYLCVFNDELNQYWFVMRALSGALNRLVSPMSVENTKKVHLLY